MPTSAEANEGGPSSIPTKIVVNPMMPPTSLPTAVTTITTANANEGPTEDSEEDPDPDPGPEPTEEPRPETTEPWEHFAGQTSGTTATSSTSGKTSAKSSSAGASSSSAKASSSSGAKASTSGAAAVAASGDIGPGAPPSREPFGTDGNFIVYGAYKDGAGSDVQKQGAPGPGLAEGPAKATPSGTPLAALAALGAVVGILAMARRR